MRELWGAVGAVVSERLDGGVGQSLGAPSSIAKVLFVCLEGCVAVELRWLGNGCIVLSAWIEGEKELQNLILYDIPSLVFVCREIITYNGKSGFVFPPPSSPLKFISLYHSSLYGYTSIRLARKFLIALPCFCQMWAAQ